VSSKKILRQTFSVRQTFSGCSPQSRRLRNVRPKVMRRARRDFVWFVAIVVAIGPVVEIMALAGIVIKLKVPSSHVHNNVPLHSNVLNGE
jgi:hypothetical protein